MNTRMQYIDTFKGVSILAIVLLHYEDGIFPGYLNKWIGSFMITGFYLTSGWLMGLSSKKLSVKEHFNKRIPTLIRPYLWFSVILFLFDILLFALGFKTFNFLLAELYKTFTLRGIGTLWFLPALLGGELIFTYLRDKKVGFKLSAVLITALYFFVYWKWSQSVGHSGELYRIIDAPFRTLANVLKAWVIIAAGYYLARSYGRGIFHFSTHNRFVVGSFAIVVSFLATFYLPLWLPASLYVPIVGPFFVQILCPFSILLLVIAIEKFPFKKFFIFWGENSLILMATHFSILMEICIIVHQKYFGYPDFSGVAPLYYFALTILLTYPIVFLINSKARFLIGK